MGREEEGGDREQKGGEQPGASRVHERPQYWSMPQESGLRILNKGRDGRRLARVRVLCAPLLSREDGLQGCALGQVL